MPGIDEVSEKLGTLNARYENLTRELLSHKEETNSKLDNLNTKFDSLTLALQTAQVARAERDAKIAGRIALLLLGGTGLGAGLGASLKHLGEKIFGVSG